MVDDQTRLHVRQALILGRAMLNEPQLCVCRGEILLDD